MKHETNGVALVHPERATDRNIEKAHPCLEAALDYLARGWSALAVCPPDHHGVGARHAERCESPGKAPWGRWKQFQLELPTADYLREKWREIPTLNVGITLGGVTGLVGLDVDGEAGEEVLARLAGGDLPQTLEFASGKGRRLLYRAPEGVVLMPTPKPGGLEVEGGELRLLGLGSQTVMPPSVHASGREYAWVPGRGPSEIESAAAPSWVVELMRADKRASTVKTDRLRDSAAGMPREVIRKGKRNSYLTSLAGSMRRRGMAEASIAAALATENAQRCDPPLEESEVRGIAESVAKYAPAGDAPVSPDSPYRVDGGRICRRAYGRDGEECGSCALCNFVARIAEEVVLDDGGGEPQHTFLLEGTLAGGKPLPTARVAAADFASLGWTLRCWGATAVVKAGNGAKDQLREAIQLLSGDVPRRTVYRHTGWRQIDGVWTYLHAGGGITASGQSALVTVELDGKLGGYRLPPPPDGDALAEAVRASLGLLEVALASVMAPGLGAVYRAPLGPADGSVFYDGPTGVGKSELTALLQQHYGAGMGRLGLPGAWTSTANALEAQMFLAKDAVFVLDDFKPQGSRSEVDGWHSKADRVFRSQGNGSARQRCWADGRVRADRPPRCLVVSTGEDRPRGESCAARRLDVHLESGMIDLPSLTPFQREAASGVYAEALAGYICWLAGRLDDVMKRLPRRHERLRDLAASDGHPRTPGLLAELGCGWHYFLAFAVEVGAVTSERRDEIWDQIWKGLLIAGKRQATEILAHEPARRFLELLSSAIGSGRAHVATTSGREPEDSAAWGWLHGSGTSDARPGGPCIGWLDGQDLYLDPESAYAAVQQLGESQGERLPVSQRQLNKRLDEQDFLVSKEKGKLTNRRAVGGRERAVLHLRAVALSPGGTRGTGGTGGGRS